MAGTAKEKRLERALKAEGLVNFRGWYSTKDADAAQLLSAKTAKTVKRIKGEICDDNGKSDN